MYFYFGSKLLLQMLQIQKNESLAFGTSSITLYIMRYLLNNYIHSKKDPLTAVLSSVKAAKVFLLTLHFFHLRKLFFSMVWPSSMLALFYSIFIMDLLLCFYGVRMFIVVVA